MKKNVNCAILIGKKFLTSCPPLAGSDGLETGGSRSIGLTLLVVSSATSWDWSILVNIQTRTFALGQHNTM